MSDPAAPPSRDADHTRQRLLRAGLELFTSTGFRATTTPMLAERAGIAEGTIYRHFASKEQLLNEVYRTAQRWAAGLVREGEERDRAARARDRLQRLGRRLVEAAERDPAAVRMLLATGLEALLDDASRDAAREVRTLLAQLVASGKSEGTVRAGPAELWAAIWWRLVGLVLERVASREWAPDHAHVGLTLDAAWVAIAAPEERPQSS